VWIFSQRPDGEDGHAPHLNLEQAKRVRDALDAFISEHSDDLAPG
jgi:hypothetical protein